MTVQNQLNEDFGKDALDTKPLFFAPPPLRDNRLMHKPSTTVIRCRLSVEAHEFLRREVVRRGGSNPDAGSTIIRRGDGFVELEIAYIPHDVRRDVMAEVGRRRKNGQPGADLSSVLEEVLQLAMKHFEDPGGESEPNTTQ